MTAAAPMPLDDLVNNPVLAAMANIMTAIATGEALRERGLEPCQLLPEQYRDTWDVYLRTRARCGDEIDFARQGHHAH